VISVESEKYVVVDSDEHKRLISNYIHTRSGVFGYVTWSIEDHGKFKVALLKFTQF
jgi:hypothetical protein